MAQFDVLIIFPLLWSLLFILVFYYYYSLQIVIPNFFSVKKFREKKFESTFFYQSLIVNSKVQLNQSYK
jgi:hypothetical protein